VHPSAWVHSLQPELFCPSKSCLQAAVTWTWIAHSKSCGFACNLLQQLLIMTVVMVHFVFQAQPTWPDA
jgi:hypothetical protein